MLFKQIKWTEDICNREEHEFEEIEDEELYEDGEINDKQVKDKIFFHLFHTGEWKLIRRIDG